jgi:glycosyltransferase involved in cell wall biosynthesis
VTLFCYGSGEGDAAEDVEIVRIPKALSPRSLRAGPSPGKPLADVALAQRLATAPGRFDAVIAHNGEGALTALLVRGVLRAPVVYVAHTLLGNELDAYAPAPIGGLARRFGDAVDRGVAARADAVIALCADAARRLGRFAKGPVEVIPPGLDPMPPPDAAEIDAACARAGVERDAFVLYAGNVDRYQDLEALEQAARRAPELRVLLATHGSERFASSTIRCLQTSPAEARALIHACRVAVSPRARAGGFPVKLLNYMEASRAIVAREGVADTLVHGRSAWLLRRDAPAGELAAALQHVSEDAALAARLGAGARAALEKHHDGSRLARRTLELVDSLVGSA